MEEKPELEEGTKTPPMDKDLEVRFNNVKFAYADGNSILKGVDFSIRPGERVAIVGGSGSGKSTLAKLLFRFYDPKEGSVQLNGEDIRNFNLKSFREKIGVVPQDCGENHFHKAISDFFSSSFVQRHHLQQHSIRRLECN